MSHLKRLAAPKSWRIGRKEKKFVVKPVPGPHKIEESIPLLLVVRDILGYAKTSREAKKIINEGRIVVDKKIRRDLRFPAGLMDIIEIPTTNEGWIVLLDGKGKLTLKNISKNSSRYKLCKIVNKTVVKGGNIQLNLHDGRNFLVEKEKDEYKTKDALLLDLEKNAIKKHLHFKEGSFAFITGGKHKSEIGRIEEIKKIRSSMPNIVVLSKDNEKFQTVEDYVFVIGEKKIAIPEVAK
ncbi:MAG: 30S ribosomal protein S4e [Methanobacteriota archaeon]